MDILIAYLGRIYEGYFIFAATYPVLLTVMAGVAFLIAVLWHGETGVWAFIALLILGTVGLVVYDDYIGYLRGVNSWPEAYIAMLYMTLPTFIVGKCISWMRSKI